MGLTRPWQTQAGPIWSHLGLKLNKHDAHASIPVGIQDVRPLGISMADLKLSQERPAMEWGWWKAT